MFFPLVPFPVHIYCSAFAQVPIVLTHRKIEIINRSAQRIKKENIATTTTHICGRFYRFASIENDDKENKHRSQ